MPQVPVRTVNRPGEALCHLSRLIKTIHDEIREEAFRRFRQKGCTRGDALDDWVAAEQELLYRPPCEVAETEDEIRIQALVPAFDAEALQVDILPHSITIEGHRPNNPERTGEIVHFSEFGEKRLLRQLELPAAIDPEHVEATLDNGVLQVVAKKARVATSPIVQEVKLARRHAA